MSRSLVLLLLLLALVGCGPDAPPVREQRAPIINGQEHDGHPAVGQLVFAYTGGDIQDGDCTATLVGQKTVITAAHCLGFPLTDFHVGGGIHEADRSIPHPNYDPNTPYLWDMGLVVLKTTPSVEAAWLAMDPPQEGMAVTLVGFGVTAKDAGDSGIKRLAQNTISSVEQRYFGITGASGSEGNACYGDSGGPAFVTHGGKEALAGIISFTTGECGANTYCTRVDRTLDWLQQEGGDDLQLLDVTPPTVTIDAPADGSFMGPEVELVVSAEDTVGVAAVEARIDGEARGELTEAPYLFALTLAAGEHVLEAVARDASGNESSAAVTVDVLGVIPLSPPGTDGGLDDVDGGQGNELRGDDGCSYGGGSGCGGTGVLLLLALLLTVRRTSGYWRRD
jgi:hypothetical protein